jgi:flagellar motor protein MotB
MMALFSSCWRLMNSSKQIQEAVGGYFKDPTGTAKQVASNMVDAGELKEQLAARDQGSSEFRQNEKSH